MTSAEFRSWLEGYLEGKDTLDSKQIARILERLKEVQDLASFIPQPTTTPIIPPWPESWRSFNRVTGYQ